MSDDIYSQIVPLSTPLTDISYLTDKQKELLSLALATDHGMPLYKIRHFVGDAQITRYAKYRQLMLELRSREEIIEQMLVTYEKQKAQIEEKKEMIAELGDSRPAAKKVYEWDMTTLTNDVAKTSRRLKMAYKERDKFMTAIQEMYDSGEAYLDDGTDLKEALIDDDLGEKLEAEHWTYRLGKQAALDLIAYGHIGTGNLEAISMMTEEQAVKTLQLAMTYSHSVKKALGTMEQTIIEAIDSGSIQSTTDISQQQLPEALKEIDNK